MQHLGVACVTHFNLQLCNVPERGQVIAGECVTHGIMRPQLLVTGLAPLRLVKPH